MSEITKYMIVGGTHELDLERKVDAMCTSSIYPEQWETTGGVAVVSNGCSIMFYQAMIKVKV